MPVDELGPVILQPVTLPRLIVFVAVKVAPPVAVMPPIFNQSPATVPEGTERVAIPDADLPVVTLEQGNYG